MAANAEQIDYWNGRAGETWARFHALLDRQIAPLGEAGLGLLDARPGERVLDIGCGAGTTTRAIAASVAPPGAVVGVDISRPLLSIARGNAPAGVSFLEADAQVHDFGARRFDAAFSRFGVMFFADPVAAFANVARALKPSGRLVFVCWRPLAENPWMRAPLETAAPLLPPMPAPDPLAPGPFAFADPTRVRAILHEAGFDSVDLRPHDAAVGGLEVEDALTLALRVGPLGMALREAPELLPAIAGAVRAELERNVRDGAVWMAAAVHLVEARLSER